MASARPTVESEYVHVLAVSPSGYQAYVRLHRQHGFDMIVAGIAVKWELDPENIRLMWEGQVLMRFGSPSVLGWVKEGLYTVSVNLDPSSRVLPRDPPRFVIPPEMNYSYPEAVHRLAIQRRIDPRFLVPPRP